MRLVAASLILTTQAGILASEDPFQAAVRPTGPLTAAAERTRLHAPAGFTIQLFASEPMINKPINMAFDARGRLWVSSTVEYPYAAKRERWADDQCSRVKDSRDAIKILEDTDGDGRADKVIDFADGLNIPTGVLPWHKPEHQSGCIAFSIPNIWYFADTDGDGRCDVRRVLFGPLGYEKDTHGMCSSFRFGLDGWVYATHGFNNASRLKVLPQNRKPGAGNEEQEPLELHSGNVFRFRPDGSAVEIYTSGQVNPFGLCWDRYGNLYSADCHSNPITQLIHGACYPSLGKPHDGLGFGPVMCEHSHGSTGLCGIVYADNGGWGKEWDDHILVGNCVTSRVNHDKITFTGSTPKAHEQPDFITSDDPWFRPVDLQFGPDGALYIADFYNKIIGHYEVPLDHPERDRERGRIWRVVKNGETSSLKDWADSTQHTDGWKAALASPNPTPKRLAIQYFESAAGRPDLSAKSWCGTGNPLAGENAGEAYGWLVLRHGDPKSREQVLSVSVDLLRNRNIQRGWLAARFLGEAPQWSDSAAGAIQAALESWPATDAIGLRAIADAVSNQPAPRFIAGLSQRLHSIPENDPFLRHATVIALRNCIESPGGALPSLAQELRGPMGDALLQIVSSARSAGAAALMMEQLGRRGDWKPELKKQALTQIAAHGQPELVSRTIDLLRERDRSDVAAQVSDVQLLHDSLIERGSRPPAPLLAWASELAASLLTADPTHESHWFHLPHPNFASSESPWRLQERRCADGAIARVVSSLDTSKRAPEKLTGILRSKPFPAPAKLSFWLCGHQGFPPAKANGKNFVQLIADGKLVKQAFPPRNDVCRRIEWNLGAVQGRPVSLELVDGDNGNAFAWLGITRIEPEVVSIEKFFAREEGRKQLTTLAKLLRTTASAGLRDKLNAYLPPQPRIDTAKPRPEIEALIAARRAAFVTYTPVAAQGERVFKASCAVCHQLSGQGGLIGPQLDGIGSRGAGRLIEDILDPNRNVDAHFFLHQLKLRDGSSASGFVRGETIHALILVDAAGNEQRIAKADVVEDKEAPQSLMPPVFGESLTERDLFDLLGFLAGS